MVQATNGRFFSAESNEVAVKTLDPTLDYMKVSALPASFITGDSFTANWEPLADAEYYTVTLYSRQLGVPFEVKATARRLGYIELLLRQPRRILR